MVSEKPLKAVVMARGLGTRMRRHASGVNLDAAAATAADSGVKAMIPLDGRPFLDHLLNALVDAGWTRVCLVIGPEHDLVREYYDALQTTRLRIEYAVQQEPRGTADAVLAAEAFADGEPVLVVNGDNYYPPEALAVLAAAGPGSTLGFERGPLCELGNIPPERVRDFAVLITDPGGSLLDILEKPSERDDLTLGEDALVSMNCWWFDASIFDAARTVTPSARGELELPDAVRASLRSGHGIRVIGARAGVLDLSRRDDIAHVTSLLRAHEVRL